MTGPAVRRTLGVVAVLSVTAGWLAAARSEPPASPATVEVAAQGGLQVVNSRQGRAIFSAARVRPGQSVAGVLTLTNRGRSRAALTLSKRRLRDTPGPYGGRLSSRLQLTVEQVVGSRRRRVYRGPLGTMRALPLRPLAPREARRYRFVVRLPDGGRPSSNVSGDNRYQGSRISVDYRWRAVALGQL